MWTVVFVSQDRLKTERLIKMLNEHGIMTMRKDSGEDDFGTGEAFEILVPQTELEMAQDIIFDAEIQSK